MIVYVIYIGASRQFKRSFTRGLKENWLSFL